MMPPVPYFMMLLWEREARESTIQMVRRELVGGCAGAQPLAS